MRPTLPLVAALVLAGTSRVPAQPNVTRADTAFDVGVAQPTYTAGGPRVLVDADHMNYHTAAGRYAPLAALLANDGYQVAANHAPFSAATLAGHDLLVIAGARGAHDSLRLSPAEFVKAGHAAFTETEVEAVEAWVRAGGALLLITDHYPESAAMAPVARRFGVDTWGGDLIDSVHSRRDDGGEILSHPGILLFSRENGLLAEHAITIGRTPAERVGVVQTFAGQSLTGPPGSATLLRTGDTALEVVCDNPARWTATSCRAVSAGGRGQAVAFVWGKGRVVVLGEAAMLTAQRMPAEPRFPTGRRFGMNVPGVDNRQLALNIAHWLTQALR